MRHAAEIALTGDKLRSLLHLPDNVTIRDVKYDSWTHQFRFLLEGEHLPAIHDAAIPPIVRIEEFWSQ